MKSSSKRQGFTLVELLVVIAIIGIIRPMGIQKWGHVSGGSLNTPESIFPKCGFSQITDGSSNTMMFAEKSAFAEHYNPVIPDDLGLSQTGYAGGQFSSGVDSNGKHVWPFIPDNAAVLPSTFPSRWRGRARFGFPVAGRHLERYFGSPHPGTVNMVLGDGSTHAASMDTEHDVIHQLSYIADGTVLDHPSF